MTFFGASTQILGICEIPRLYLRLGFGFVRIIPLLHLDLHYLLLSHSAENRGQGKRVGGGGKIAGNLCEEALPAFNIR
jgi:hypothetical protein